MFIMVVVRSILLFKQFKKSVNFRKQIIIAAIIACGSDILLITCASNIHTFVKSVDDTICCKLALKGFVLDESAHDSESVGFLQRVEYNHRSLWTKPHPQHFFSNGTQVFSVPGTRAI